MPSTMEQIVCRCKECYGVVGNFVNVQRGTDGSYVFPARFKGDLDIVFMESEGTDRKLYAMCTYCAMLLGCKLQNAPATHASEE